MNHSNYLLTLVLTSFLYSDTRSANILDVPTPAELRDRIESLTRTLDFVYTNNKKLIVDTLFGITTGANQVRAAVKTFLSSKTCQQSKKMGHFGMELYKLLTKFDKLQAVNQIDGKTFINGYEHNVGYILSLDTTWRDLPELKKFKIRSAPINEDLRNANSTLLYTYLFKVGSPQPEDSQKCLSEIISKNCLISDECRKIQSNTCIMRGYITTHRLLFYQLVTRMGCAEKNPSLFNDYQLGHIKESLCEQIYHEIQNLVKADRFTVTQDILMEQIALCGIEGYLAFATPPLRKMVASMEGPQGCYGNLRESQTFFSELYEEENKKNSSKTWKLLTMIASPYYKTRGKSRTKRDDVPFRNGCLAHATGVGIAAVSFHLRTILDQLCRHIK